MPIGYRNESMNRKRNDFPPMGFEQLQYFQTRVCRC